MKNPARKIASGFRAKPSHKDLAPPTAIPPFDVRASVTVRAIEARFAAITAGKTFTLPKI